MSTMLGDCGSRMVVGVHTGKWCMVSHRRKEIISFSMSANSRTIWRSRLMAGISIWCMEMWPVPGLNEYGIDQTRHRTSRPYQIQRSFAVTPALTSLIFIPKDTMRTAHLRSFTHPALLESTVAVEMKQTYAGLPVYDWKICKSSMCEVKTNDFLYK